MNERTETAALDMAAYRAAFGTLRSMVAEYLAGALAHGDDGEHRRVARLARGLDEAGLNLNDLIDAFVTQVWDMEPERAWKSPASRYEPASGAPHDCPWATTGEGWAKSVTIPEPVRRVLVNNLVAMRLDQKTDEVRVRAVVLAGELAAAGADLYAAVDERAHELKPGTPPLREEAPF